MPQAVLSSPASNPERWRMVLNREPSATFFYAVRSTGIYCRPECPSRRPAPDQVSFFEQQEQAVAAGFRPCRRCQPDATPAAQRLTDQVKALIDAAEQPPTLNALASQTGVSPSYLQRTFSRITGLSPRQYGLSRRVDRVRSGLRRGSTVTEAMYNAGFGSSRSFYEVATQQLGMQPRAYRNHGRGQHIRYAIAQSKLGVMLVAATERGLCFVGWGEPHTLRADLMQEFAEATIDEAPEAVQPYVEAVQAFLQGNPSTETSLDVQGTPFQLAVWAALTAIPAGETRTYAELARGIGKPASAARAVGRACATNLVAPLIPCHRAVGANGSLTGYRWGTERKRALLDIEQSASSPPPGMRVSSGSV